MSSKCEIPEKERLGSRLTLIKSVLGSLGSSKLAWVKWLTVLASLGKGGLGIGSLKSFNLAILQKWRWRFFSNLMHYGLMLYVHYMGMRVALITSAAARKISSGLWFHYSPLEGFMDSQWSWNWSRSDLGTRNEAYLNDIINERINYTFRPYDACYWCIANGGVFTVGITRKHLDDHLLPSSATSTCWDKTLPHKVNFFLWRLKIDRLSHRLNLSTRGIEISDISCPSCSGYVESSLHIFFEFDMAKNIWRLVRSWCGNSIPLFTFMDHWRDWLSSWHVSKEKIQHMYIIIASSLWYIWQYRNNVMFSSLPMRKNDIFDNTCWRELCIYPFKSS
ncbi:RNA-directed DNA polymerase, eukaryota [Tanacetum coccineum]